MIGTGAILMMGGLGLIIGAALAAASKIFYVYVDPKIEGIDDALPGANCGGCGLPVCSANAEAIVAGTAEPDSCVAASAEDIAVIAGIMGVSVEAKEPDIASPGCYFGTRDADTKYLYTGVNDCRAAALQFGGMKICSIGCLGLGTCAKECPFDAISMGPEGLPVVNPKKCTGCGTCERVCPKHIIKLSSITRRIIREYTIDECTTPCQRGCPAGIDIREYIHQISLGNNHRAVQVIKERNPFPAVIGRICPRPCELECRRNLIDVPVAINYLKRYAADFEKKSGNRILPYKAPDTGNKIAVIGGGVEGLSTAFFAARLGHEIKVFEGASELGGILRVAISRERLPRKILDWDIEGILEMGVEIETQKALGKDFTIESLFDEGFKAVFLATGGWDSRLSRGPVSEAESVIPGTYLLMDLLKFGSEKPDKISCGPNCVISGGGRLALEAAKTCKEIGAEKITILLRESEETCPITDADVENLGIDGIDIIYDAGINRLLGEKDRLTEIEYIEIDTHEITIIPAHTLIVASGRFPELIFTRPEPHETESGESQESVSRWIGFQPYKQPALNGEVGIFARGDVRTDYSAAIKAIGAGRRCAASIHQAIYGIEPYLSANAITPDSILQDVDHLENVQTLSRQIMPTYNGKRLEEYGEAEGGFSEDAALIESARCLQCGLICYESTGGADRQEEASSA